MNSGDLIETARGLAELSPRRPSQTNLRRAVSTAYYAMFHCLASTAADLLIGRSRTPAWHQVYRALEHGRARNACLQKRVMRSFPAEVRDFAEAFVTLQNNRHLADYALDAKSYRKSDVVDEIKAVESTIGRFEGTNVEARRSFAAHVLFRRHP